MTERDGVVVDDGFVPFEPRRWRASPLDVEMIEAQADTAVPATDADGAETDVSLLGASLTAEAAAMDVSLAGTTLTGDLASAATEQVITTAIEPDHGMPQQQSSLAVSRPYEHRLDIRREAIRLAAIACGRALRHAALLHPQTIAGFVDDAIAATGNPRHARIHLHPQAVGERHDAEHEWIGDADLGYEDVIVECEGTRLSADIHDRAALLVHAAAEQ